MDILLLDNFDSFTYNLYHLVRSQFSGNVEVTREPDFNKLDQYSGIIISPGPGNPTTTPRAMELIYRTYLNKPILGICLGMQCINQFFGGETIKSTFPIHGKQSFLTHDEKGIFYGIPNNIKIARYHSLVIDCCSELEITATSENLPMAIKHKTLPIYGLQFHPESFLCEYGDIMVKNFLEVVNEQNC